ncbi:hypothetical protein KJ359_001832 [Pestalotiopsis sp. 9143b]|nr:hypothetical protein KJ359_001832 [Pestalotiopsis sp. 9143b]
MEQHGLYLILSSRPHTEVEEIFTKSIIRYSVVTAEAKRDMEAFIDDQIAQIQTDPSHSTSVFLNKENLERLRAALLSQANVMFRWA